MDYLINISPLMNDEGLESSVGMHGSRKCRHMEYRKYE